MMGCQIIPDGYTQSDTCCGLNVVYRPLPYGDHQQISAATAGLPADVAAKIEAEAYCSRINRWDAMEGETRLPITAENFLKLPPVAGMQLTSLLLGSVNGDNVPNQQDTDEKNSEAA